MPDDSLAASIRHDQFACRSSRLDPRRRNDLRTGIAEDGILIADQLFVLRLRCVYGGVHLHGLARTLVPALLRTIGAVERWLALATGVERRPKPASRILRQQQVFRDLCCAYRNERI